MRDVISVVMNDEIGKDGCVTFECVDGFKLWYSLGRTRARVVSPTTWDGQRAEGETTVLHHVVAQLCSCPYVDRLEIYEHKLDIRMSQLVQEVLHGTRSTQLPPLMEVKRCITEGVRQAGADLRVVRMPVVL